MGRRKKTNQKTALIILSLILCFAGTGCGDGRQAEGTETSWKMGAMSDGYFFEESGIVAASSERFLYSDWEPIEFDYICMDPTCSHQSAGCSARTVQDEAGALKDFSLLYQDRLIILHAYRQLTIKEISETVQEWTTVYQTDVYEADADGSNRRKVAGFSGSIGYPGDAYAAVLADGKLYFGGPTEVRDRFELDTSGEWLAYESWTSDAVYCLDLKDYTLETFAVMEDKEGECAYQYQFYVYDEVVYAIVSSFQGDSAVWYRIVPQTGVCDEILRFDSNAARFGGAIGETVYYTYENSWRTLYARDLSAEAEENEIMTAAGENVILVPFVVDGQLLCMNDSRIEGENLMVEYAVLASDGSVQDTIRYDDYITFLDVVGDKIIYFKGYPDWEIWWADKEDLTNLTGKGVRIGPVNAHKLDSIAN